MISWRIWRQEIIAAFYGGALKTITAFAEIEPLSCETGGRQPLAEPKNDPFEKRQLPGCFELLRRWQYLRPGLFGKLLGFCL